MSIRALPFAIVSICALLVACNPSGQRPGTWLSGKTAAYPSDWAFTSADREIAIEVRTPYLISHSVTIWCAAVDGTLYVAASNPEAKHWPHWADEHPDVRLKIAGSIYDVHLAKLADEAEIAKVRAVYAAKYQLNAGSGAGAIRSVEYWRVEPRA